MTAGMTLPTAGTTGPVRSELHFLGPGDPDHLDPASPYHLRRGQLLRAVARQLFAYPTTEDVTTRTIGVVGDTAEVFVPVPDVARELPMLFNGGLSADLHTYTIRLRDDVWWDTEPRRTVTAQDFVRGLTRLADPVVSADARAYFAQTIRGMREHCARFDAAFPDGSGTPADHAEFHRARPVPGLRAVDERTLVIELTEPANDFLNILATGHAVAIPREYERYRAGDAALLAHAISNGPYRIRRPEPSDESAGITLEPNPVWRPESDPIRRRVARRIRISPGPASRGEADRLIESGQLDMAWQFGIVSWGPPDPGAMVPGSYPGFTLNPYLVFNLHPESPRGAVRNVLVRRAVAYGIDRTAVRDVVAALPGVAVRPLRSILPPGTVGHSGLDPYPADERGDPERARALLAEAGYPDGVTLVAAVRDIGLHRAVMDAIARSLSRCGIALEQRHYPAADYYRRLLFDADQARAGRWDIAEPGWTPDWQGNNGRAVAMQLLSGDPGQGTGNYGGYRNHRADELMTRTMREPNLAKAALLWHQIDVMVMKDLPIVPLLAFACRCCAARTGASGWLA